MESGDDPCVAKEAQTFAKQERRKRRLKRFGASCGFIGAGGLLLQLGDFLPKLAVIGYIFIGGGVLGLLGVNIFREGPLDERLDPPL